MNHIAHEQTEFEALANIAVSGRWDLDSTTRAMTSLRMALIDNPTSEALNEARKLVDLIITQSDGLEDADPDLFKELSRIVTKYPGYTRRSVHDLVVGL